MTDDTTIEGIALKPTDDVGGTDWTEEALREAAESLDGVPVVANFGPDPETVGEVTAAEYRDGDGVWYEATVSISDERLESDTIAPAVTFGSPVLDEDTEQLTVAGIEFESLAPVAEATEAVGDHEIVESDDES